jgi:hypothetical protein
MAYVRISPTANLTRFVPIEPGQSPTSGLRLADRRRRLGRFRGPAILANAGLTLHKIKESIWPALKQCGAA